MTASQRDLDKKRFQVVITLPDGRETKDDQVLPFSKAAQRLEVLRHVVPNGAKLHITPAEQGR